MEGPPSKGPVLNPILNIKPQTAQVSPRKTARASLLRPKRPSVAVTVYKHLMSMLYKASICSRRVQLTGLAQDRFEVNGGVWPRETNEIRRSPGDAT